MGYYLFDHTPAGRQGKPRAVTISGVLEIHTSEQEQPT